MHQFYNTFPERRLIIFDYSYKTPQHRRAYLDTLPFYDPAAAADYLLFITDAHSTTDERHQEYPVITANRQDTINRREVPSSTLAVPGLVSEEDAVSYAQAGSYRDMPLGPKTQPAADCVNRTQTQEAISSLERQLARARGKRRYLLKRQLISMQQNIPTGQSVPTIARGSDGGRPLTFGIPQPVLSPYTLLPEGKGTWCDFETVRSVLRVRGKLSSSDTSSDTYALLTDFDDLLQRTMDANADYSGTSPNGTPYLPEMVRLRLQGHPNQDIPRLLNPHRPVRNAQYWASIWSNKVPQLIVAQAQKEWLEKHYVDPICGKWKVCTRCGRKLLAHPINFSFNTTASGYYSICKSCRAHPSASPAARKEVMNDGQDA